MKVYVIHFLNPRHVTKKGGGIEVDIIRKSLLTQLHGQSSIPNMTSAAMLDCSDLSETHAYFFSTCISTNSEVMSWKTGSLATLKV